MQPDDPFVSIRSIKPRMRQYKRMPVVAISNDEWVDEQGNVGSIDTLRQQLPQLPSTLFVKLASADFVAWLDKHFGEWNPNEWQWRASTTERDIIMPDGNRAATRVSTVIHYFGFRHGNYHKIIDPVVMYGHNLDKIYPGDEPRIVKLLKWGVALRDFCDANRMEVKPTTGGIASQFLTDRRFYPRKRRKVPQVINERAREWLPGNHYQLSVEPSPAEEFRAWYIDQSSAHHHHAATTDLPDADTLYAHGHFVTLRDIAFDTIDPNFYGLYCLSLQLPDEARRVSWLQEDSDYRAFVFSNEIPYLLGRGYQVNGVYASWGSNNLDRGLGRYAEWAMTQLNTENVAWLKPLLLATYGTLATKPRDGEAIFKLAKGGTAVSVVTGNNTLEGKLVSTSKKLAPAIANVIHRGMIEAATRLESIGMAEFLTSQGYKVLSIYADAVIVEDDGDREIYPQLLTPWRLHKTLNHLQFINKQAFMSGEMTKLPGVGRELRQYRQHSPGTAPKRVKYEALTHHKIKTDKRI